MFWKIHDFWTQNYEQGQRIFKMYGEERERGSGGECLREVCEKSSKSSNLVSVFSTPCAGGGQD